MQQQSFFVIVVVFVSYNNSKSHFIKWQREHLLIKKGDAILIAFVYMCSHGKKYANLFAF